jgi:hypothetical protein
MFGTAGPFAATVTGTGWTVTIPSGVIPQGEANVAMTVLATDVYGNTATHTETVVVDRVVTPFARNGAGVTLLGGDGYLNADEVASGFNLTGTGEPGSSVVVALSNGASQTLQVGNNGTWSATFSAAQLPTGNGVEMTVSVAATDRAGNVSQFSESVMVDTVAPNAPEVLGFSKVGRTVDGILAETGPDSYSFARVDSDGTSSVVNGTSSAYRGNAAITNHEFNTMVPDGSYLVINAADQAGNDSSTLVIIDNSSATTVNLGRAGLTNFDFTTIDLTWAPDAVMTLDADRLIALTGPQNRLVVKGDGDDHVTLTNAALTGQQEIGGETYNIYSVGSSGVTVLLDTDIQTVI